MKGIAPPDPEKIKEEIGALSKIPEEMSKSLNEMMRKLSKQLKI